jgi:hypothetical protein
MFGLFFTCQNLHCWATRTSTLVPAGFPSGWYKSVVRTGDAWSGSMFRRRMRASVIFIVKIYVEMRRIGVGVAQAQQPAAEGGNAKMACGVLFQIGHKIVAQAARDSSSGYSTGRQVLCFLPSVLHK